MGQLLSFLCPPRFPPTRAFLELRGIRAPAKRISLKGREHTPWWNRTGIAQKLPIARCSVCLCCFCINLSVSFFFCFSSPLSDLPLSVSLLCNRIPEHFGWPLLLREEGDDHSWVTTWQSADREEWAWEKEKVKGSKKEKLPTTASNRSEANQSFSPACCAVSFAPFAPCLGPEFFHRRRWIVSFKRARLFSIRVLGNNWAFFLPRFL